MVKQVEELGPELKAHSLSDGSPLEDREVEIHHTLLAKRSVDARLVPKGPRIVRGTDVAVVSAGCSETRGVEPARNSGQRTSAYVFVTTRDIVGSKTAHSKTGGGQGIARPS